MVLWGIFSVVLLLAVVGAAVVLLRLVKGRRRSIVAKIDEALLTGDYRVTADQTVSALTTTEDPVLRGELRRRLARALTGVEEYAGARRVCEQAAETAAGPAERADALVELARTLSAEGEFDQARGVLDRADELALSAEGRLRRDMVAADVALARYRFDDAERALAGAFATPGPGALADEAALGHARLQYLRGNFGQAVAEVNRLLNRVKGDDLQALALFTLARTHLDQERPAAVEADQAISSALLLVRYPGIAAIATACSALVQAHFGNKDEALRMAERAPTMTVSRRYAAEAHCLAGDALRRLDHYPEARAHYQKALGLDSECLEAFWGLGRCAQMSGLYEVAESYFHLCIEAAPEHFLGRRSEDAMETK